MISYLAPLVCLAIFLGRKDLLYPREQYIGTTPLALCPSVGIKNLGHTCYMNSILQGLFASTSYQREVMRGLYIENSVGYELKRLFKNMRNAQSTCADAKKLAEALRIDVNVQEDSEELFLSLINSVDESLACKTDLKPSTALMFRTSQSIRCLQVDFSKRKLQTHFDLSIDVKGHSTLDSALKSHFAAELLHKDRVSGEDNRYRTSQFGLQDAVRSLCIEKEASISGHNGNNINHSALPEVMVVHLKRFAFNPATLQMHKVGDSVEVPLTLRLGEYTRPESCSSHSTASTNSTTNSTTHKKQNKPKEQREQKKQRVANLSQGLSEDKGATPSPSPTPAGDLYELTAVVVHSGTLDSGHYVCLARVATGDNASTGAVSDVSDISASTSSARSRVGNTTITRIPSTDREVPTIPNPSISNKWMKFDDHLVSAISEAEVLDLARGGTHPLHPTLSSNAYMLFYSRK